MRKTFRISRPRRPGARASALLFALIGSLLLLQGAIEPHDTLGERAGLSGTTLVFDGARHPHESAHLETSPSEVVPPCPACLLQIQTVGADLRAPEASLTPVVTPAALAPTSRPAPAPLAFPFSGRAPPRA